MIKKTMQPYENSLEHYIANRIPWIMETLEKNQILIIAGICITIILGAAILWNQRKIKKMLRQMQEQNAAASKSATQEEQNLP